MVWHFEKRTSRTDKHKNSQMRARWVALSQYVSYYTSLLSTQVHATHRNDT